MPPTDRDVLLRDVFMHYDRDQSGDLDGGEVQQLLAAAGLVGLTEVEVGGEEGERRGEPGRGGGAAEREVGGEGGVR